MSEWICRGCRRTYSECHHSGCSGPFPPFCKLCDQPVLDHRPRQSWALARCGMVEIPACAYHAARLESIGFILERYPEGVTFG